MGEEQMERDDFMLGRDESLQGVLFHQTEDGLSTCVLSKQVDSHLERQISNYWSINVSIFPTRYPSHDIWELPDL